MQRLGLGDLEAVVQELTMYPREAWPPPPDVLHRLGVELAPASTHAVVRADIEGEPCALKIYRSWDRGEPDREWSMLMLLKGSGLAPRPVWRSAGDSPAIATGWLDGDGLRADALTPADMEAICHAHAAIHSAPPPREFPIAISAGSVTRERVLGWWDELPALGAALDLDARVMKRLYETPLAASLAVTDAIAASPLVPCRGDTHIKNYLCRHGALRLLDFEDAGLAQPVFELADMIEHFGNRGVHDNMWASLIEIAQPPPDALKVARGLHAEFWFALTIRRHARGLTMSPPTSPGEQLRRLETVSA